MTGQRPVPHRQPKKANTPEAYRPGGVVVLRPATQFFNTFIWTKPLPLPA